MTGRSRSSTSSAIRRRWSTEAALSDLATFPHFDNTIGLRASWLPNQWLVEGGYSHNNYFSDSSSLSYLDRSSEYFFGRGAWRFAEVTQAGLEASASLTNYRQSSQNDSWSISLGPYAEWQITQSIYATLRGGPTLYMFESGGSSAQGSDLSSYYLGLQVNQQLTSYLSHHLGIQRDVSLGVNQGGDYIEQFVASYSVSYTPHAANRPERQRRL